MNKLVTLQGFKDALAALDDKLDKLATTEELPISVKAIGGFALLYHSVRTSGYTADIDTVTKDYSEAVTACIKEVAKQFDFQEDWLNNYNVFDNDVEAIELLLDPFWMKVDWSLVNIQLYVADMETLVRAKLLAAEDDKETKRAQDFPDLVEIFRTLEITMIDEAISHCKKIGINLRAEYPRNYNRLLALYTRKMNSF